MEAIENSGTWISPFYICIKDPKTRTQHRHKITVLILMVHYDTLYTAVIIVSQRRRRYQLLQLPFAFIHKTFTTAIDSLTNMSSETLRYSCHLSYLFYR
ncbi:hypothetical protein BCR42DRAFT_409303 [Absidia repens]|uniref:Uncharacterized protein n=1 Tax=Absidia repens TaxID=90262 RepID=A0A1X2IQX2_9FUNG|nr:hypothetical protein BCR42DRAFT_409303 [Absidia repens]